MTDSETVLVNRILRGNVIISIQKFMFTMRLVLVTMLGKVAVERLFLSRFSGNRQTYV